MEINQSIISYRKMKLFKTLLNEGLEEQLNRFVKEHTDARLIIIDTLQKVREVGGDKQQKQQKAKEQNKHIVHHKKNDIGAR